MCRFFSLFHLFFCFCGVIFAVTPIDNGIAPPEIVHRVVGQESAPVCTVIGKPLDLLFIVDSSGSLKNKFQDELNVIREIVNIVAIGERATRVALVQFSGVQRTEFHFNTFYQRRNVLQAIDTLRHVSGVTETGKALEYAAEELTQAHGMRGSEIPKIAFLLSDGRTHDHPNDKIWAAKLRQMVPGLVFWVYGTGDYVAITELINITQDESKIVTNKNLHRIAELFSEFRGTEVCEEVPVCIPGSDRPLDLLFVVDGSNSIEGRFNEQLNVIRQLLNHVNVHPEAVQVALIMYSGRARRHFGFKTYRNRDGILDYLLTLRPVNGTTSTKMALRLAFETFSFKYGMRNASIPKMAIVLTDGHSTTSNPAPFARRLVRLKNVTVVSVAVVPEHMVDPRELLEITDLNRSHVFTRSNLDKLDSWFLRHVSFSCPGLDVSRENVEPFVKGPIDTKCTANALVFKVRTRNPFEGFLYVRGSFSEAGCIVRGDGSKEVRISVIDGTCGLERKALKTPLKSGYFFNTTMILQFNPDVITTVDQALDVNCFFPTDDITNDIISEEQREIVQPADCSYTIRKGHESCVALDGSIGESVHHRWACQLANPSYRTLVHDCVALSDVQTLKILDHNGCEIRPHIMETPEYTNGEMILGEMNVFKFPRASTLRFQCLISVCNLESSNECKREIPPKCRTTPTIQNVERLESNDTLIKTRPGYLSTFLVQTRRMNILEGDSIKPIFPHSYCTSV